MFQRRVHSRAGQVGMSYSRVLELRRGWDSVIMLDYQSLNGTEQNSGCSHLLILCHSRCGCMPPMCLPRMMPSRQGNAWECEYMIYYVKDQKRDRILSNSRPRMPLAVLASLQENNRDFQGAVLQSGVLKSSYPLHFSWSVIDTKVQAHQKARF